MKRSHQNFQVKDIYNFSYYYDHIASQIPMVGSEKGKSLHMGIPPVLAVALIFSPVPTSDLISFASIDTDC